MKRAGKEFRKKGRRGAKRSCRPHWLAIGTVTASLALGGRVAAETRMPNLEGRWGKLPPARRFDLVPGFEEIVSEPLLTALWLERLVPAEAGGGTEQTQDTPVLRFEIPPGPLKTVLAAFQGMTGLRVEGLENGARDLASPGVSGVLTVEQALEELLTGTGITYRFTGSQTVRLELAEFSEAIDVTTPTAPSSPKFTEPLRDTPQTLTVIPRAMIEEQGASTLRDVLRNVTGISIQAGEGGGGLPGDNLAIRGFSSRNDVFVDGVRDFGAYSRDPYNVEQVEVIKGPASLFAGRGSTGGSLNLSTKTPGLDGFQSATLSAGTDEYNRATFDVNHPLAGVENAALRINAMFTQADTAGRDAVENERWGVAPSLAFGLGTPTRVTVAYSYLDQDNIPDYGIPWVPPTNIPLAEYADQAPPVDFDNFYGLTDRDYEKTTTGLATLEVEHDFNDALTLRNLVRHGASERDSIITAPRFASNDSTALNRQLQSRDLEDAILAYQGDLTARFRTGGVEHVLVSGIELLQETAENRARTGPAAPTADLFDPNPGDPYTGPVTYTGARTEATARTAALYASDTVKINEKWQLNAGLRWDDFNMEYESRAVTGVVTPFERTDRMLSWRAGVVHHPLPNGSVYASYGTSFNPAAEGTTGLSLSDSTVLLEPEKSRGYELGTKWDLLNARLAVSGALFRTEKTNARTPGLLPGDPPTVLQGEQRVDGLELSISGAITDRWQAFFGYTYMDSEVVQSNTAAEVGNELGNVPDHSLSLWTTWQVGRSFEVGGGGQYVGDRFNNNTGTRVAPDYLLFDAMAAYTLNDRLTFRLNANNLADEDYIDRVGGGHFIPGAGRTMSLTTNVHF
ncbi:MAG TPA: TonB-dependent siderophore receptor [Thermoanaerobaculia bacterium]|nr:TonB-dependent siderophore receptor [Thermoanaerobaculia bacterium]